MRTLGLFLIMVAACKGGDKDNAGGGDKTAKAGTCETTAKKPGELVTGKTPQLIAPLDKLKLGMSPADAAKVCPNFFQGEDGKKTGTFSVGEIVGQFGETYAQARLEFVGDKLVLVNYSLPPEIADALTSAWGAPKVSSGAQPAHAWHDEATLTRAILEPVSYDGRRSLEISSYAPLAAFIEHDTKTIAWKPQDILGKQPADLAKSFASYVRADKTSEAVKAQTKEMMKELDKEVAALGIDTKRDENLPEFRLPATPYGSDTTTHVMIYTDDDRSVRSYGLWFRTASLTPEFGWPQQSAEILKKLDEVWGPHKIVKETLGDEMVWLDATRGLRASTRMEKPEELDLVFSKYMPLAKLFGAPGALWGFEKAERPLIGSTPDEIKATYAALGPIKHDEVGNTITLSMPPTDYDGNNARTTILMFLEKGKVAHWRFNIPYDNFPSAQQEYAAALETKLGKPGKEKYGNVPYGKLTKVRWSDITKSLEVMQGEK